ncbi:MAG: general secretion pathway protein GspK [Candidatus Omnitrophica bacterium]|nr:general secretion pathway protein GspK [Candidatus Omnitrophota bacterium]
MSLLTVIGIMGVAFAFSTHLETREALQFVATNQARYVAEAGVAFARALLEEDQASSGVDDSTEGWATYGRGSDIDTDGDRIRDARWWPLQDPDARASGRYAWQITDEAGKANLNVAEADPSLARPGAINLISVLQRAGLDGQRASTTAAAIVAYRLGPDGKPGRAGIDDDADGAIDEADEYQPMALLGDDRRLEGMEELAAIAGFSAEELGRLAAFATVYSWDLNVSASGAARVNVNTTVAEELLSMLLDAGVRDPWQAAVNLSDAADRDVAMSRVTRSSQMIAITDQGALGSWTWSGAPSGHYASAQPGGAPLSYSATVTPGTYRVLARGLQAVKVGDVTIEGRLKRSVDPDESLGLLTLSGSVPIEVANREPTGTRCAFQGIELVSETAQSGVVVRGVEAIRFNEVMAEPVIELEATEATFNPQGSDWGCPVGSAACTNSGVGEGRWSWTVPGLRPGRYAVRVFGASPGQTVGLITIDGTTPPPLTHGQAHPATLLVGSDHRVDLAIGKTGADGTYYFQKLHVSAQPDGEYVEFINLSDGDIDMSGWSIEGELTAGRQAHLPAGSVIRAHGLLVAAVDLDDHQTGLQNNGLSARQVWEMPSSAAAVQLEFPSGAPSLDDDWLKIALPAGTMPRLMLRQGTNIVDEVEYPLAPTSTSVFQSLEKGDPSLIIDANGNSMDDGWYASLRLYTPGEPNDNEGLKEQVGVQTIIHDPAREVRVLNRPLAGVGELVGLSSGVAWRPFASGELAKIVDRLTVYGHRLEAEGHFLGEEGGDNAWHERADGAFEHYDPAQADVVGRWQWTELVDGHYRLNLYGRPGEQLAVRWWQADGAPSPWSPALSTDAQGRAVVGLVTIGMQQTPPNTLALDVRCASLSGVCHLDAVQLDPQLIRMGVVNINTAPREVLLALPGMTAGLADRLIAGRPFGNQGGKGRGIGDLLVGDVLGTDEETKLAVFEQLGHLVTTRSSVFQILSVGQALNGDRATATQRIQAIVQR